MKLTKNDFLIFIYTLYKKINTVMKKMYSFRFDEEIHEHLKKKSKENFMSITSYLTQLITKDIENKKLSIEISELNRANAYNFNMPGNITVDGEKLIAYYKNRIIENAK